jgi:hypothetical protein
MSAAEIASWCGLASWVIWWEKRSGASSRRAGKRPSRWPEKRPVGGQESGLADIRKSRTPAARARAALAHESNNRRINFQRFALTVLSRQG